MTTMQRIEEIRNIVAEYNFGERRVKMYHDYETVNEILNSEAWTHYSNYTRMSKGVIDREVDGLYNIVVTWKEAHIKREAEPKVEIILVKSGKHKFIPQSEVWMYTCEPSFAVLA